MHLQILKNGELNLIIKLLGEESKSKSLQSFYYTPYGSILQVNSNTNKLTLPGDQILFESSDCSGTPYIGSINPVVMTNRSIVYRPVNDIAHINKPFGSRFSNFVGESCFIFSSPQNISTSYEVQTCSLQDCPFVGNSDIVFEEN